MLSYIAANVNVVMTKYVKLIKVTTLFVASEQDMVRSVVKKLGGYRIASAVSETTTHVICGNDRRTLNVLLGICRGSWLLSLEWVRLVLQTASFVCSNSDFFRHLEPVMAVIFFFHADLFITSTILRPIISFFFCMCVPV